MPKIRLIHNVRSGFDGTLVVTEGTTVGQFLRETVLSDTPILDSEIRLNRLPVDLAERLKQGDILSILSRPRYEGGDRSLTRGFTAMSEDAFRKVWDNPEDAVYDDV